MSDRLFVRDKVQLDASKIETDTDPIHGPTTIFKDVVIASEIVHEYDDGWAYKPADELEKAFWTWNGRWAKALDHPENGIIMNVDDIQGKTENVRFVKNLKDHKTGRPNRRGILADLVVFDKKVAPEILTAMKNGSKRDVSIGFFFTKDETPGNWNGTDYSYIQRAFMGDHTAFGLEVGRCSFPNCGIGADELITSGDPFAGYAGMTECIEEMMKPKSEGGQGYTRQQAAGTCAEIEKRSKAKHKSDVEAKLSMEKVTELKSKVKTVLDEVISGFDDLVEEEYQGNAELENEARRAMEFFNISEDDWHGLPDEMKMAYIRGLPPKKKRAGGEEMSAKDCTYEWVTVRDKILELEPMEPVLLSVLLKDMKFEEDMVTLTQDTMSQLTELGVELDDCECDEEEEEIGEDEQDDYDEFMAPYLAEDAVLSYAAKKALPDSAYAYIESGCEKEDGKTAQRCRHMPIHDESHVRAALAALKGARTGKVPSYASKAKGKICSAARKFKIESEVCGTKGDELPSTDEVLDETERILGDLERIVG